jgi:hypothetical protein
MKAIVINGSPRRGGNTEIMLKKVLEPLEAAGWSTEYRQIGRDARNGQFIPVKEAIRRPSTTIVQTIKKGK